MSLKSNNFQGLPWHIQQVTVIYYQYFLVFFTHTDTYVTDDDKHNTCFASLWRYPSVRSIRSILW